MRSPKPAGDLPVVHRERLVGVALVQRLTHAEDGHEAGADARRLHLWHVRSPSSDSPKSVTTLRVADDDVTRRPASRSMFGAHLAGVGALSGCQ